MMVVLYAEAIFIKDYETVMHMCFTVPMKKSGGCFVLMWGVFCSKQISQDKIGLNIKNTRLEVTICISWKTEGR